MAEQQQQQQAISDYLSNHVATYQLLKTLAIVSQTTVDKVESYAQQDIEFSPKAEWDMKALEKVCVMTIHVGTGGHRGWQDGGFWWHVLKLENKQEYALVGAFFSIQPCPVKELMLTWLKHVKKELETAFYKVSFDIHKKNNDTNFIVDQWKELAKDYKNKLTTASSHPSDGEFPILHIVKG